MGFWTERLTRHLPEGARGTDEFAGFLSRVKSVNEFLGDAIDAVQDTGLPAVMAEVAPWWALPVGEAFADAVPPVRFAVKLLEGLGQIDDPEELGYLACTLAYQRAVEQGWREVLQDEKIQPGKKKLLSQLREAAPEASYDFQTFSYEGALQHPFIEDADAFLEQFGKDLGLSEATRRSLLLQVHGRFVPHLKMLLCHGKTREKFAPFADLLDRGTGELRAFEALLRHADTQRWAYEERPVLGREPFALHHVYAETECGKLTWGDIQKARKKRQRGETVHGTPGGDSGPDPFREGGGDGGRHPLVPTVLELLADPDFDDAIVLQGVAGAGKSSFTLRLCWELVRLGLRPIRVALRDLDTRQETSIEEALPRAVRLTDPEREPEAEERFFTRGDLFQGGEIWKESVLFQGVKICPYVLILDGWDEISLGASDGYQQQVERMLRDVRETFLRRRNFPVRVLLTGRPSDAVTESKFLRDDTVLLTLRPLLPEHLEQYVGRVRTALRERPVSVEGEAWNLDEVEGLQPALERYRKAFEAQRETETSTDDGGSLEILGLPLLAHLALRLMAEWPGQAKHLLEDTTLLYRSLLDLVVGKRTKAPEAEVDPAVLPGYAGEELRALLQRTAEAMTVLGLENISHDELEWRLQMEAGELDRRATAVADEQVLSRLLVSFFFKGGHQDLGCEFSHKSFREYLFAERVVEILKGYGRETQGTYPERPAEAYWQDFAEGDPRRTLCHTLLETLGPQWISPEVRRHLTALLRWEIARAAGKDPYPIAGEPTAPVTLEAWERVRDGLADAWDWWGEGVHLRPQPKVNRTRQVEFEPAAAHRFAEEDRLLTRQQVQIPKRTTTLDAHLGEGLFLMAAIVHSEVAVAQGWKDPETATEAAKVWEKATAPGKGPRRYQCSVKRGKTSFALFEPSGKDPWFFFNYCARINAGGYRRTVPFPSYLYCQRTRLPNTIQQGVLLFKSDLTEADLRCAYLRGADLRGADLSRTDLREADLSGANISGARLKNAVLSQTDLSGAFLRKTNLRGADLRGAVLSGAHLQGADLRETSLRNADLRGADLRGVVLASTDLHNADLHRADLRYAKVSKKQLQEAHTEGAVGLERIRED